MGPIIIAEWTLQAVCNDGGSCDDGMGEEPQSHGDGNVARKRSHRWLPKLTRWRDDVRCCCYKGSKALLICMVGLRNWVGKVMVRVVRVGYGR